MKRIRNFKHLNKKYFTSISLVLLLGVITAQAGPILNTPALGYLVCVNSKTKVVTHPGTSTCPKGSKKLILGAQGIQGLTGAAGFAGTNGKDGTDGKDGKTLWNGVKDPENNWGSPGDMFINSVTKTLFGPKNLDGTWASGVSLIGPKGDQGSVGLTGAMGPQGPGGSGPQGPAGATGATGPAGISPTFTCAQGGVCEIGDRGPGGGIVFYVKSATANSPWRYMEAAPNTWADGVPGDPQTRWCHINNVKVGNLVYGTTNTDSTFNSIGTGLSNTKTIVASCGHGAAKGASNYGGGGKSDWILPSLDELVALYNQRSVVGGFSTGYYWSSSERDAYSAWVVMFDTTTTTSGEDKSTVTIYVRPIRIF